MQEETHQEDLDPDIYDRRTYPLAYRCHVRGLDPLSSCPPHPSRSAGVRVYLTLPAAGVRHWATYATYGEAREAIRAWKRHWPLLARDHATLHAVRVHHAKEDRRC